MTTYTAAQRQRRDASPWTTVQMVLAPIQFLTFVISLVLVVRYLMTGDGYGAANVSVLVKIAIMWLITITGMIWEKDVFGIWFLAPQFFWEDALNAFALVMHNLYFVAVGVGASQQTVMIVMLVAYVSYLVNFAQFFVKGLQARKQKLELAEQAS